MPLFDLQSRVEYGVRIWSSAIHESFERINLASSSTGIILELASGGSPFRKYISSDWLHVPVDIEKSYLDVCAPMNVIGDVHSLPFKSSSVDVVLTVSSVQYFEQEVFFEECRRVVKVGGVVLLHENGPANPFIIFARAIQRLIGIVYRPQWRYRNTIRRYLRPNEIPTGFRVEYRYAGGLFSPLCFMVNKVGIALPSVVIDKINEFDVRLINRFPSLQKLAFLNIIHLRRE
jgi:SAM-dependent methyltransferase